VFDDPLFLTFADLEHSLQEQRSTDNSQVWWIHSYELGSAEEAMKMLFNKIIKVALPPDFA
jgi:hypothetical protein